MKIGIIGKGFVGSAVEFGFSAQTGCDAEIKVYDKDPSKSTHSLEETVNNSDFVFVSVPTPSNLDGSIHTGILESVLSDINNVYNNGAVILIRSTVVPGTTRKLQEKFNLPIVFNPEFLTERSAKFDFINQARFSFMNEMKLVADKCGVDWETATDGFVSDGRIGHTHLAVPGPDGKMGFGGSCFPKDVQAMITFGKELGMDLNTLQGAWTTNCNVRPEKDWEKLEGRAVVEKPKL